MFKLLVCTFSYPPFRNGVANASFSLVGMLIELGNDVDVITFGSGNQRGANGEHIERFRFWGNGSLWKPVIGERERLYNYLSAKEWDWVILNGWQNWATDVPFAWLSKIQPQARVVLRSHGLSTDAFPVASAEYFARYLGWRIYRYRNVPKILKYIRWLVVLSSREDNDRFLDVKLARLAGTPIRVIPNIAPSFLSDGGGRERFRCDLGDSGRNILLCVGGYSPQKNEMMVLRAYKLSGCYHIPLVFVGPKENDYQRKLKSYAIVHGLKNVKFRFGIFGDELKNLYCRAIAVLSGSLAECQPLALLDAMATKTPFISTGVGCVEDFPGGVITNDELEMSGKIVEMVVGSPDVVKLATLGYQYVTDLHDKTRVKALWRDLIEGT